MRRVENGSCPYCGSCLQYTVKEEPTSWKVYFECTGTDCTRPFPVQHIPRSRIDHLDEVYERAEKMHPQI